MAAAAKVLDCIVALPSRVQRQGGIYRFFHTGAGEAVRAPHRATLQLQAEPICQFCICSLRTTAHMHSAQRRGHLRGMPAELAGAGPQRPRPTRLCQCAPRTMFRPDPTALPPPTTPTRRRRAARRNTSSPPHIRARLLLWAVCLQRWHRTTHHACTRTPATKNRCTPRVTCRPTGAPHPRRSPAPPRLRVPRAPQRAGGCGTGAPLPAPPRRGRGAATGCG